MRAALAWLVMLAAACGPGVHRHPAPLSNAGGVGVSVPRGEGHRACPVADLHCAWSMCWCERHR